MDCTVIYTFDNEPQRWTAASDDKYGLVLESNSLEALMERVKIAMPDMLEFTCNYTGPVNLHFWYNEAIKRTASVDSEIKSRHSANEALKKARLGKWF